MTTKVHRHGNVSYRYAPRKLKEIMRRYCLSQTEASATLNKMLEGYSFSRSALSLLIDYNRWPARIPRAVLQDQIQLYLQEKKVAAADVAQVFELDETTLAHGELPVEEENATRIVRPKPNDQFNPPEKEMLTSQARTHFKLFRDPFSGDMNSANDVFLSADQRYIRETLYYTAKNGGFVAVVGEVGSGKSTLRKDLIDRIAREQLPVLIIQPRILDKRRITARSLADAILGDLAPGERPALSLERLQRRVEKILTESGRAQNRHLMIIEEAQDLDISALKLLKRLYEIEDGFTKLLGIVLIGQPELKEKLDERIHFEAREVIRRCEVAELQPLDANVGAYLEAKLSKVGSTLQQICADDVASAIRERLAHKTSRGVISMTYPLMVNNLMTKAMNLAAQSGFEKISADIVKQL